MKAIILAAGRGTRMSYMTAKKPKCLVELNGISLLERQLSVIKEIGIKNIGAITGYRSEEIKPYFKKTFFNAQWSNTQMVYSLYYASEWLKNDECIVSYSDIFYEKSALNALINSNSEFSITYDPNWLYLWNKRFKDPLEDAESFKIDSKGLLKEIGSKVKNIHDIQGQYMGLIKITPKAWEKILCFLHSLKDNEWHKLQLTHLMNLLISNNILDILAIPYTDNWGEVDTINDLNIYSQDMD